MKGLRGDLRECLHGFFTPLWRTRSSTADRKISVHLSRCNSRTTSLLLSYRRVFCCVRVLPKLKGRAAVFVAMAWFLLGRIYNTQGLDIVDAIRVRHCPLILTTPAAGRASPGPIRQGFAGHRGTGGGLAVRAVTSRVSPAAGCAVVRLTRTAPIPVLPMRAEKSIIQGRCGAQHDRTQASATTSP